jgi:hypothetical protein
LFTLKHSLAPFLFFWRGASALFISLQIFLGCSLLASIGIYFGAEFVVERLDEQDGRRMNRSKTEAIAPALAVVSFISFIVKPSFLKKACSESRIYYT